MRFFVSILSSYLLVLNCILFITPPIHAQTSRTTRITISLDSHHDLVINNGVRRMLVEDYLSSTRVIVRETGDTLYASSFYPYGSDSRQPPPDTGTDKGFTGHRRLSSDISTYHAGARFYSPSLGIFVQPDAVEGPHRYGYVRGNPVSLVDPKGTDSCNSTQTDCDFMGHEGLGTLGRLMAGVDTVAGGIGSLAAWVGDKLMGDTGGSESMDSAYASLSGGAALMLGAVGMASPDPGDVGRMGRTMSGSLDEIISLRLGEPSSSRILDEIWKSDPTNGNALVVPLSMLLKRKPELAETLKDVLGAFDGSMIYVADNLKGLPLSRTIAHERRHFMQDVGGWPRAIGDYSYNTRFYFTEGSPTTLMREIDAEIGSMRAIHKASMKTGERNSVIVRREMSDVSRTIKMHIRGMNVYHHRHPNVKDLTRRVATGLPFYNEHPWARKMLD